MGTRCRRIGNYILVVICLIVAATACTKNPAAPEVYTKVIPEVRPVGVPTGPAVTKQIGPAGGTLTTPDQLITITVPAGALNTVTTIGIEPITNTNLAGIGTSYSLTPHGQQFAKPVAVKFSYAALTDSVSSPQMLGLAFQGKDGIWRFVGADVIDTTQKTVTYETRHFSSWSLMNQIMIAPYHADLNPDDKLPIKALLFIAKEEDLIIPLPGPVHPNDPYMEDAGYPIGTPVPLPTKYIRQWRVQGPGKLSSTKGNSITYTAPSSIPSPTSATVVTELVAPSTPVSGQFMLICAIHLMSDSWIEMNGGKFPASPAVRSGDQYVLANPSNEGGGYFGMKWVGGVGTHAFNMGNSTFHYITPQATYVSMFRLRIEDPVGPSGSVTVTRIESGRIEGTFDVPKAGYGGTLIPTAAFSGKFSARLFVR